MKPNRYKVTIVGSIIISVGPKVLLDDLVVKAENLKLDSIDKIELENEKGDKWGRRTPNLQG